MQVKFWGFFVAVASVLLAAGTVYAKDDSDYPRDGTVKIEKSKQFRGIEKVLVPHFALSFVVADQKSAVASTNRSNRFARKATSTTRARLAGLTDETMQAITNQAYADFIQSLKDNGIEVVQEDAGEAQALARQTKMPMTRFVDGPAKNYSAYRKAYNNNITDQTFSPTGTQLLTPRIGNAPIPYMYGASARELGVPVLVVDYVVTFGHIAAEAKEYYGIAGRGDAAASTSFSPGLQVMWSSDIKLFRSERKTGRLMIEKNAWTAEPFATMEANDWAGSSRTERDIVVTVDNALYQQAALDVIARATDNLVTHMVAQ